MNKYPSYEEFAKMSMIFSSGEIAEMYGVSQMALFKWRERAMDRGLRKLMEQERNRVFKEIVEMDSSFKARYKKLDRSKYSHKDFAKLVAE